MLNRNEIAKLFYGSEDLVMLPDHSWMVQAEALGLNPEHYIIERETNELVNIYSLYAELVLSESDALKSSLSAIKKQLHGTTKHEFMIAPNEYDFYGQPLDRDEHYYYKMLLKTDWANSGAIEFSRMFSQGDTRQPIKTEELIHLYTSNRDYAPIVDEATLVRLNEADLSIHEWERAVILKEFIDLQLPLKEDIKNHTSIFITEVMPKKYMYGQCIVYNKNKEAYSVDGKWSTISNIYG